MLEVGVTRSNVPARTLVSSDSCSLADLRAAFACLSKSSDVRVLREESHFLV